MPPRWLVPLLLLTARVAHAQEIRGLVRDSATGAPVSGAVVVLLDAAGVALDRDLSSGEGRFVVGPAPAARRLRVVRLGFRPREIPLQGGYVEIAMLKVSTMLEAVTVVASACPRRGSDDASAMAFYEHARAGLLAMVVARQQRGSFTMLRYDQALAGSGGRILSNVVRIDSSTRANVTFTAARGAHDFVESGFGRQRPDGFEFLAPDADVLLDDTFARGYCFSIAAPRAERPGQIGLAFAAARPQKDRVDVEGTLWVDTTRRSLRDIEYRYVGLDPFLERFRPGGSIAFAEMANGAVLISRWAMHLIGARTDTVSARAPSGRYEDVERTGIAASISGGELASARWSDGTRYQGSFGRLRLHARDAAGRPARTRVHLVDTPFGGVTDSSGVIELGPLIPGPYALVIEDSALSRLGIRIPTRVRFNAVRDSTHIETLLAQTAAGYVRDRCVEDGVPVDGDVALLLVRVMRDGDPVKDVDWRVTKPGTSIEWKGGRTGTDGAFQICTDRLKPGDIVHILAWPRRGHSVERSQRIAGGVTLLRIDLDR